MKLGIGRADVSVQAWLYMLRVVNPVPTHQDLKLCPGYRSHLGKKLLVWLVSLLISLLLLFFLLLLLRYYDGCCCSCFCLVVIAAVQYCIG